MVLRTEKEPLNASARGALLCGPGQRLKVDATTRMRIYRSRYIEQQSGPTGHGRGTFLYLRESNEPYCCEGAIVCIL